MADRNEVHIEGRAGKDADVRHTQTGKTVARFSVACSTGKDDKKYTEWINVTAWGDKADWCASNVVKGRRVKVLGSIHNGSYVNKEGNKVYTSEVIAFNLSLTDDKESAPKATQKSDDIDF